MATVGSAIVCDRLRLYGNSSLCDRLRSTIRDRLRSYGNQPIEHGSIFCDRLRSRSQAIAEMCFHMIADDRRTFCDPRSSTIIWKPALYVCTVRLHTTVLDAQRLLGVMVTHCLFQIIMQVLFYPSFVCFFPHVNFNITACFALLGCTSICSSSLNNIRVIKYVSSIPSL